MHAAATTFGVLAGAALLFAAPATATPEQDYVYYSQLNNSGVTVTNGPVLRDLGQAVCKVLDRGYPWRLATTNMINMGFSLEEATTVVSAAVNAYCPGYAPAILQS